MDGFNIYLVPTTYNRAKYMYVLKAEDIDKTYFNHSAEGERYYN